MLFHIVVIKIGSELTEIEFAKKFCEFFTCGTLCLLSTLLAITTASVGTSNLAKMIFFESRSFDLRVLGGRLNDGNRSTRPQMTSQIAGMLIS